MTRKEHWKVWPDSWPRIPGRGFLASVEQILPVTLHVVRIPGEERRLLAAIRECQHFAPCLA